MSRIRAFSGLIMNLLRRPATVPEGFGFLPDTFRWLPRRDAEKCTGCGACYERCSSGATDLVDRGQERLVIIDGNRCIFCGRCVDVCPEKALESNFEARTEDERKAREERLKEMGREDVLSALNLRSLGDGNADQEYVDKVSLNRYPGEKAPTTETTLKLQRCSVCGEIMPATEKYLQVVEGRTLQNLKPETARVVEQDMKKYLTACIACRQKYSLIWGTHPRKWV